MCDIIQGDGKSVIDKYGNCIILKDDQRLFNGKLQAKFKCKSTKSGWKWRILCKNINENGKRCEKQAAHKKEGFCKGCYSKENGNVVEGVGLKVKDENNNTIILKKDQRLFNGKLQAKFKCKSKNNKSDFRWINLCKNINENNEICEKQTIKDKDGFCCGCYNKSSGLNLNDIILEEVGLEIKDENDNTIILKKDQRLFNGKLQAKFKDNKDIRGYIWRNLCKNIKNGERCEKREEKDGLCMLHCPIDENLRGKTKYKEIKYVDGTTYKAKFRNDGKNNWKQLCKNCCEWLDAQEIGDKKKYDQHCVRCFVRCFPKDPRCIKAYAHTKELKVKKWLMESGESFLGYFYSDFIHDKVMYTTHSKCFYKRRIDFRRQINNTILCIEVNEKQHKTKAYKEDEERRKNNIVESNTFNYVFILFNPDSFKDSNGKRRNPPIKNRFPRLKEEINKQIKRILNEENNKDTLLEEIKLFYDEFEY